MRHLRRTWLCSKSKHGSNLEPWIWYQLGLGRQDLISLLDVNFQITPPDNNLAQTEMTSGETQHFEPESLIRGESGANQDTDSESSTDWAYDELEYDASGSGEQEEMERESETSVRHLLCLEL